MAVCHHYDGCVFATQHCIEPPGKYVGRWNPVTLPDLIGVSEGCSDAQVQDGEELRVA
jgi:hypothetical protein